jgi:hypothetical protein
VGFSKLPDRFTKELDETKVFSHTAYNFPALIDVCEKLARQALARSGGRVEKDADGKDVFVIPVQTPRPSKLELSWAPGPIANSRFTEAEMARITEKNVRGNFEEFAPGWRLRECGTDMAPGLLEEYNGRKPVFLTHPVDKDKPARLVGKATITAGRRTTLQIVAGHHPQGDWELLVRADGEKVYGTIVGKETAKDGWLTADIDLSKYAGRTIKLEVLNKATGWSFEGAYWAKVAVVESEP